MSDPLCYIYYMIMSIYEVQTHDGDATLGWIQGHDDDHAQRVAERLYCKGVLVVLCDD
jgi:4-alpha-glucanotransferase